MTENATRFEVSSATARSTGPERSRVSEALDRADSGTAVIEFIFAAIVLLIPVVYLMLALSQLQAASYATTSAAVSASRIAARDANPSERRAEDVAPCTSLTSDSPTSL